MSQARSREPLERDGKGTRILTHDRGGYARGCGCDACRQDHAAWRRDQRAARSSRTAAAARRAVTQPARRGGMQSGDVREVSVTSRLSEQEAVAFREYVAAAGESESGFIRDLILEAIGFEDTARRPAQRRRNYSERQQDGKQQGKGQQQ